VASVIRRKLSRPALGLALGILLCATGTAQATTVRSFRPIQVKGTTMLFKVSAVSPERVKSAQLVTGGRAYRVKVTVIREALRTKRLVRAHLARAVVARAKRRSPRRATRLKVFLKPRTVARRVVKADTVAAPAGSAGASSPAGSSTATGTGGRRITASGITSFPCSASWGEFGPDTIPGACWRPYADSSPFNRPLPANPRLAANSAAIASTVDGWGQPEQPYVGDADTTSDWDHPYYFSRPSDPTFTVHCTSTWGTCEVEGLQVRIPDAARAAGGGDGHMAVIDEAGGWEYDFWKVASKPKGGGTLSISWGGRTKIGTDDSDGLGSDATAAQFGLLAGIIRYPEIAAGEINHALFMITRCANGHVYPAAGNGSACPSGVAGPAIGQHLVLDMSAGEIAALDAAPWQKTILTAMARYGVFVGDTGGQSWGLQFESGSTYTSFGMPDPWVAWATQQPGVSEWKGQQYLPRIGVNWGSRLKVVDPCVDRGTC
jgi:hypothetical protein